MKNVSVIIPTHNRGDILKKTIDSYLNDPCVFEVIIVDDGSDQTSKAVLHTIAINCSANLKIKLLEQENLGAPAARNYGISNVSKNTRYIFFGEDDAYLEKNAISRLVRCIEENSADMAGGLIVAINSVDDCLERPAILRSIQNPININIMRADFKAVTIKAVEVPFLHALFLAKKWIFDHVRFDENYYGNAYREETDFCLEASKKGAKIFYCPDSALFHIEAPGGGQRRISRTAYETAILKNNWYFLNKQYKFLKEKHGLITPKICLQGAIVLRRIYLALKKTLCH